MGVSHMGMYATSNNSYAVVGVEQILYIGHPRNKAVWPKMNGSNKNLYCSNFS